ncbi:MAG: SDR family oxidoreductase [Spirochaetales bacterium]|nr:SDR family oxidoreductase [Spirochaetales bacterium]
MKEIKGKTALITGAATGIGRATSIMLAELGVNIAVNFAHSDADARALESELSRIGVRSLLYRADVSRDDQVRKMVSTVKDQLGRIDFLVNNAGVTHYVDMDDLEGMSESYWDDIMGVNVKGNFFVTRACAAELRKNGGRVVNVSSIAGEMGRGSCIAYAVSKAAVSSLTRAFARVLAPEATVNAVAPGIVNTRWVAGREKHIQTQSAGTPLQRIAEAEDVARMIVALITSADFVTGQIVVVDGGFSL